jgi:hypothetical protein
VGKQLDNIDQQRIKDLRKLQRHCRLPILAVLLLSALAFVLRLGAAFMPVVTATMCVSTFYFAVAVRICQVKKDRISAALMWLVVVAGTAGILTGLYSMVIGIGRMAIPGFTF